MRSSRQSHTHTPANAAVSLHSQLQLATGHGTDSGPPDSDTLAAIASAVSRTEICLGCEREEESWLRSRVAFAFECCKGMHDGFDR